MTRVWLQQIAQLILTGEQLHKRPRRPTVRLGLEVLEDRTVPDASLTAIPQNEIASATMVVVQSQSHNSVAANSATVAAGLDNLYTALQSSASTYAPGSGYYPSHVAGGGAVSETGVPSPTPSVKTQAPSIVPANTFVEPDSNSIHPAQAAPAPPSANRDAGNAASADAMPRAQTAQPDAPIRQAATSAEAQIQEPVTSPSVWENSQETAGPSAQSDESATATTAEISTATQFVQPSADELPVQSSPSDPVAGAQFVETSAPPGQLSDGYLLRRFSTYGEESAFAALFERHEQFVLNVFRRVLGDSHAAEDALQATFMVLARKASTLDSRTPLGGWLFKVAYHLALRIKFVAARRGKWEKGNCVGDRLSAEPTDRLEQQEIRRVLYEELQRLPAKFRVPLTLCYLEGRTHADAASAIGMPRGSMAKRIAEALDVLRERMIVRGLLH